MYGEETVKDHFGSTAAPNFRLTATSGTGSGRYPAGRRVISDAGDPPAGHIFEGWAGDTAVPADISYKNHFACTAIASKFSMIQPIKYQYYQFDILIFAIVVGYYTFTCDLGTPVKKNQRRKYVIRVWGSHETCHQN